MYNTYFDVLCARYLYRQVFVQIDKGSDGWEGFESITGSMQWVERRSSQRFIPSLAADLINDTPKSGTSVAEYHQKSVKSIYFFSLLVMAMDEPYITLL